MVHVLVLDEFFTTEALSRRQKTTPEGFLLCEEVPIARTGTMIYAGGEVEGVAAGKDGLIIAERSPDDVFDLDTIASFMGKPLTNDHPDEFVSPDSWNKHSVGVVMNVRRGGVGMEDLLVADLLVTNRQAIDDVRKGKREVSCGYDSEYIQTEPGRARQTKIRGNHVALVDRGRCGYRCAIGDSEGALTEKAKAFLEQNPEPSCGCGGEHDQSHTRDSRKGRKMTKRTIFDRMRTAFKAKDEAAFEEEVKKAEDEASEEESKKDKEETKDAIAKLADSVKKIGDGLKTITDKMAKDEESEAEEKKKQEAEDRRARDEEAKAEEERKKSEDRARSMDSASLQASFRDAVAKAEIIAPGVRLPTFDAKAPAKQTTDAICALQKDAVARGLTNDKARDVLVALGVKDVSQMSCDAIALAFNGASEIVRRENNRGAGVTTRVGDAVDVTANSVAEINKRNAEFWKDGGR